MLTINAHAIFFNTARHISHYFFVITLLKCDIQQLVDVATCAMDANLLQLGGIPGIETY